MFTDPSTLFALALCIGILGLLVLILPLFIVFWSQMEPQLVGMIGQGEGVAKDEYPTQAVLPRLMKSFDDMAERNRVGGVREAKSKPGSQRKAGTGSRSKASNTPKTVKTAPKATNRTKKSAASKSATKSRSSGVPAKSGAGVAQSTSRPSAAPKQRKAKSSRRTPAGAKRDPILGVVYSKKPKEIDDLKQIKGVAKVIEGKLHRVGIYTFRQVAEWDEAAIDAFSEKLSFKGRIRNEAWQEQCSQLHQEKYGEKLA